MRTVFRYLKPHWKRMSMQLTIKMSGTVVELLLPGMLSVLLDTYAPAGDLQGVWLMEAVSNVVKNAFDHTGAGGCILIEWKAFISLVQITVKDNGCGIHPEDLYHIFKRFYRSRFSKDTQGAGLGLPLAKAIVEAHNGTIEVKSRLGAETCFTINFLTGP